MVREPDFAVCSCRAYNDFFHPGAHAEEPRLKGARSFRSGCEKCCRGSCPTDTRARLRGIDASCRRAEAAARPPGLRGRSTPRRGPKRAFRATMVGVHRHRPEAAVLRRHLFDRFIEVHTLRHRSRSMIQMTSMGVPGVFAEFPRLKVAFLEPAARGSVLARAHGRGMGEARRPRRRRDARRSERVSDERPDLLSGGSGEWLLGERSNRWARPASSTRPDWPHWDNEFPTTSHHMEQRRASRRDKRQIFSGTGAPALLGSTMKSVKVLISRRRPDGPRRTEARSRRMRAGSSARPRGRPAGEQRARDDRHGAAWRRVGRHLIRNTPISRAVMGVVEETSGSSRDTRSAADVRRCGTRRRSLGIPGDPRPTESNWGGVAEARSPAMLSDAEKSRSADST